MSKPIVIVYVNLGPYHIARLRALGEALPEIHVIEVASKQELYPWGRSEKGLGFSITTLFPNTAFESVSASEQRRGIRQALRQLDPGAVVVAGYSLPVMREAARWARKHDVAAYLMNVSTELDHPRKWWKEFVKRRIMKRYEAVLTAGQRSADYTERLGMRKGRIYQIGNVVENVYFTDETKRIRENAERERAKRALPEQYFLAVSRLSLEKNLLRLLAAFKNYRVGGGKWSLVIVGGGPQDGELRDIIDTQRIPGVVFVEWQTYEELPAYYALASCFILPSLSESWGLVVNEAMACGLPVLVSRRCGCFPELCQSGINGYGFDPYNTAEITQRMALLSNGKVNAGTMGQTSQRIISSFTPQTWAASLRDCILSVDKEKS